MVFPGAAFLEMARAACCAGDLPCSHATLRQAVFLQPLPLDEAAEQAWLGCSLGRSRSHLEIRSYPCEGWVLSGQEGTAHFAALAVGRLPGAVAGSDELSVRRQMVRPIANTALYAALHAVGLEYKAAYRMLEATWTDLGARNAAARLVGRRDTHGTWLHPADLDAALQLTMLSGRRVGQTLLPFSVGEARLSAGAGILWAVCRY